MKINKIILPSYNSTDGISVDIFLSGCGRTPKCRGCHNPELWNFDNGEQIDNIILLKWLKNRSWQYDNLAIMGGEPLSQALNSLRAFILNLKELKKPIWLYTSYELKEIPLDILTWCEYVKTGKYEEEKKLTENIQHGIKLASDNQKIYKRGIDY